MDYTISGTEISAILGLNPYMDPMKLYMRKLGLIDPDPENEAMRWGIAAEHVVARRYAKETGYNLSPSIDAGYDYKSVHPECPWWVGTPDRLVYTGKTPGILEIKIVGERMAHQWGDPPDGDVPEQYLTQCAWYMPLLNVEWADLAVQIGNKDYRVYRINRDREFEDTLRDAALAFINDHLIPQIPPEIDGSESSKRYLNYRYPREQGPILEPTDDHILQTVAMLKLAKENLKNWENVIAEEENKLKVIIGDAAGLQTPYGKIYWKKNKDSVKMDWQGLAEFLLPCLDPDKKVATLNRFTTIKSGARVFRAYFKEDL